MDTRRKPDKRIKVMVVSALMLISVSFFALYIYATYISPTASESIPSAILIILAHSALAILIGLNMTHFSAMMKKSYPGIARDLPLGFVLVSILIFWIYTFILGHPLTAQTSILYSLISLGAWLLLNIVAHLSLKEN
jgi:hypothetical protein